MLFQMGLTGKLLAGVMADRLGRKQTLLGYLMLMIGGFGALLDAGSGAPWIAIAVLGQGWGGIYTLQQMAAAEFFNGTALDRIVRSLVPADSSGAAFGSWGIGLLYDRTGSYDLASQVILGVLVIALVATLVLRRMPSAASRAAAA